jgi:PncC family amidohydrolase
MTPRRTPHTVLARRLGRMLAGRGLTLAVAESCTGGMLGATVTSVPGSSAYFRGGVVSYANDAKRRLLGVPARVLSRKGAVSAETARAMATGARRLFSSHCAISTTGIAGPGGGTKKKPVGLVYIGIAAGEKVKSYKYLLKGNRRAIRSETVNKALERMMENI